MRRVLAVIGRALRQWWQEPFLWILMNIGWLVMQVPILTGPAATAAMVSLARKAAQGDYLSPREGLIEMQRLFIPALKWGVLTALILGAVAGNLYLLGRAQG